MLLCVPLCALSIMFSSLYFPIPPFLSVSLICQYPSCLLLCIFPSLSHLFSSLLSPHLFLVSSLVSVYLVSACPLLYVSSLMVSVCLCWSVVPWVS